MPRKPEAETMMHGTREMPICMDRYCEAERNQDGRQNTLIQIVPTTIGSNGLS